MALSKIVKTSRYNLFYIKIFFSIFILIFNLQSFTKADDIRDFQIEGMSIGDSALDYFSKADIKRNNKNWYKNNKFSSSEFSNFRTSHFGKTYDVVQISYISSDNKYILQAVTGIISYRYNIKDCYKKMDKIVEEVSEIFKDHARKTEKLVQKHNADKSGKSKTTSVDFYFDSGDRMYVSCFDWSTEIGYNDNLRLHLGTKEFKDFLTYKAF